MKNQVRDGIGTRRCGPFTGLWGHVQDHHCDHRGRFRCPDGTVACGVVAAAKLLQLPVMALPDSRLEALCRGHCGFIREGFADRRYRDDGTLVPRDRPDAFVHAVKEAVVQADWLLRKHGIATLCVHGDNPQALEFVRGLRKAFAQQGINVRAFV